MFVCIVFVLVCSACYLLNELCFRTVCHLQLLEVIQLLSLRARKLEAEHTHGVLLKVSDISIRGTRE